MRKLCSEAQNEWSFAGITCVFVRMISAAATENAGLCVAAVVRTALGHVNDVASRSCGACGAFAAFPPGFLAVRGCEHRPNGHARDGSRSDRRNRFSLRLLFRVELCGGNGNDIGVFEHARSWADVRRRSPVREVTIRGRPGALRFDLLFVGCGVMDVIGRAATLYRKRGMKQCFFMSHRKITSE
jgi:hypothetical protein